jgi:hypothetical protein
MNRRYQIPPILAKSVNTISIFRSRLSILVIVIVPQRHRLRAFSVIWAARSNSAALVSMSSISTPFNAISSTQSAAFGVTPFDPVTWWLLRLCPLLFHEGRDSLGDDVNARPGEHLDVIAGDVDDFEVRKQ